ncbi:RNA recognition motif domain-containing protein [Variovorax soli]|uniref:RNA recognition motif domain-containing protein n=1 Tax=Variovorax soli TaxID=376815 RepID=UPI0008395540|nr:RNA-binding protein [Variovorax soli]
MARLWIGNIEDKTTDEELQELLTKYGFPKFDSIERVPGDGSRPAAIFTFGEASPEGLALVAPRIQDLFWKHRKLTVQVMRDNFA